MGENNMKDDEGGWKLVFLAVACIVMWAISAYWIRNLSERVNALEEYRAEDVQDFKKLDARMDRIAGRSSSPEP